MFVFDARRRLEQVRQRGLVELGRYADTDTVAKLYSEGLTLTH